MQIILLAAGQSSRIKPLSDKSLIKVCGKEIISHQIDSILEAKLNDFLIVCNEENIEKIKEICKNKKGNFDFCIQKNQKDGMKGAIQACGKKLKENVFIISSNDIVENSIFKKMLKESEENDYFGFICGKVVENYFPGGYISCDENNFLKEIVEKPGEGKEPSNKINLVLHIFKNFSKFVEKLEVFHNSTDDAYEKTIGELCKVEKIKIVEYSGFWQAVKYPWHLLSLNDYFLSKISKSVGKSVEISENVVIKGEVEIGDNVKIYENSVISGPCFIGNNTIIGNNSLIINSSIGENSVIGFSSEITRSLLEEEVFTHKNYIGDSIISKNVSFGAGTITGNLRLDEENISIFIKGEKINSLRNKIGAFIGKNCRFGINISLNPGIKIGENSMIAGGIVLGSDVEKNSFIYEKENLIRKENKKIILKRI